MDITPLVPADRQLIHGYGDLGFTISGVRWEGSVLVLPGATVPWRAASVADADAAGLAPVIAAAPRPRILLLGCGPTIAPISRELRTALRAEGIVVELMDTGAACRTYNVLLTEDRLVAAALIAV
ncbi:MAG: Mth938-like domain-containing protein [Magnetospirillum sp.]|nr:Mth938-like domain-containing protein [Magnetospirillum sp.]